MIVKVFSAAPELAGDDSIVAMDSGSEIRDRGAMPHV
jgi:hypothetical protein